MSSYNTLAHLYEMSVTVHHSSLDTTVLSTSPGKTYFLLGVLF